ncbi:P-loop containing nucleoside triphosphate hydrolase protein [Paraphaeosphaeria sporulosa]|uniref:RNA helicase n=1 Tax=Paraphaeosphaeria sporulosa TaxID=1460663 RepID=A0A177CUV5_9PLEO|nr:P-loop containing nucleoside triphosphate hydrolase protein [Paraphaeosphaeria sporulosa]OAG10798.1 P-loop containing nucleoside triphosphate hydrolase protein [Paraphaeosphaeria sporulosa]
MPKFTPRQRKHKVIARQNQNAAHDESSADANATEIIPEEQRLRAEKKAALKNELVAESKGKMSGKKKKRLDKYIDTKLKKEENLVLLKKLASTKMDTSGLRSTKNMGKNVQKKRERVAEGPEEFHSEEGEGSEDEEVRERPRAGKEKAIVPTKASFETQKAQTAPSAEAKPVGSGGLFGAGLKRPLEVDESGKPVIQVRKRRKGTAKPVVIEEEVPWEGFNSDEDENEDESDSEPGSASEESEGSEDGGSDSASNDSEEGSEDESSSDTSEDEDDKSARKERSNAFKAWATAQRNEAIGFVPTNNLTYAVPPKPKNFTPRAPESDPLPPELETKTATDATRKAYSVAVERTPEIQEARLQLPVVAEEQKIMEAIHNNDVVVVWGATGSGKTTQVPQFLYEAGYGALDGPTPGMIGVTQPRRVAAVSMSKRVGDELGSEKAKVAYQIRFDTSTNAKTAVKFMTDGVLLREISQDFILTKYSAIVIDEAHERSVNTDILIGMLSRIVDLRADLAKKDSKKNKPLKLIIMSATLRISDFTDNTRLFRQGPPPLLKAEGRQFEVTNHFARKTQRDYVEEMFRKVCRGHRKLPRGGMLVFLTGQNEITHLAKRLRQTFTSTQGKEVTTGKVQISPEQTSLETEDIELGTNKKDYEDDDGSDSDDSIITGLDDDEEKDEFEDKGGFNIEGEPEPEELKIHVLPLYSQLPTNQQMRVFDEPPEGSRLIVLATNVAETSLTIPGIRYVFDCGRAKEKKYDLTTGVQTFEVGWISKASANQRAGRAGRTGPGHCYRLYSSAVFERDFDEYAEPEIMRTPLEGVVLQLKSMGAPVLGFPFPTPPDRIHLQKAENLLLYLGAVSLDGKVTKLGHELSLYPLNPRFARILVMGVAQNLTAQTIALVAALSVPELITPENKLGLREPPPADPSHIRTEQDNVEAEERSRLRKAYNKALAKLAVNAKYSDCIKLNNAVCAYAYESDGDAFCEDMFLNAKGMREAGQLRQQLTSIVRAHRPTALSAYQAKLPAPTSSEINVLAQICAAGFIDQIALRADLAPIPPELPRKPKTAIDVPYLTLFSSTSQRASKDDPVRQYVYIHPSSLLARTPPAKLPAYIIYSHLQRAAPSTIDAVATPKTRMHPLTPVTRPQIINIALNTPLLQVGKPKGKIVEMGREGGVERRECEVEMALQGDKGSQGWGLGVKRVVQKRDGVTKVWSVERVIG